LRIFCYIIIVVVALLVEWVLYDSIKWASRKQWVDAIEGRRLIVASYIFIVAAALPIGWVLYDIIYN